MDELVIKAAPQPFKLQNNDENFFTAEGYATTYKNADLENDIIMPGAFNDGLKAQGGDVLPILWQHDRAQPVGVGHFSDKDSGVFLSLKMPKNDTFVTGRVLPQLSVGSVSNFSIGMRIDHSKSTYKDGLRYINRAQLVETSFVTFPANPEAKITHVKSVGAARDLPIADADMSWDGDAARERVQKFTKSEESPSSEYKKAFLWYDSDNADNFTAYKLPFADVVDGELKAVPAGLSAALGAIRGARGGVKGISAHDMASIKSVIKSYYTEMGKPNPFAEKQWDIEDVKKCVSAREFEGVLRESGIFSKAAATYLAKCFVPQRESVASNTSGTVPDEWERLMKHFSNP